MAKNYSFSNAPSIHMPRNKFDLSHRQLTTATVGRLQPFLVQEVYPGDTFFIDETTISKVSSAFIKPPTGNLWLETYYFFVPNRLVMEQWSNVVGKEAEPDSWQETIEYTVPQVSNGTVANKSIADFMRIPKGQALSPISLLPFRAFALVYDTWFRNQNVIDKTLIQTDETADGSLNANAFSPNNYLGMCPNVGKFKDLFTTALPSPQKGEDVNIPIGIPQTPLDIQEDPVIFDSYSNFNNSGLKFRITSEPSEGEDVFYSFGTTPSATSTGLQYPQVMAYQTEQGGATSVPQLVSGTNLVVPQIDAGNFSINEMRMAFAMQRQLEKFARVGTRYQEILNGIWGVNSPDARLQRPEYLAGKKTRIQFQQVAQTSSSVADSPSASLTAYSNTLNANKVGKTFVEHGFIIGVLTIRQEHLYQQGLERFWSRKTRNDFYSPEFAHIGEQPVYAREIFMQNNDDVFGYQEAWYDLRARQSAVTGEMSSSATNSLDIWHFADNYENAPVISQEFIEELPNFVDRTLAIPSTEQDQFIIDTWFDITAVRRLPIHSIPGLIDHY